MKIKQKYGIPRPTKRPPTPGYILIDGPIPRCKYLLPCGICERNGEECKQPKSKGGNV